MHVMFKTCALSFVIYANLVLNLLAGHGLCDRGLLVFRTSYLMGDHVRTMWPHILGTMPALERHPSTPPTH
jgi:hypothetical protein